MLFIAAGSLTGGGGPTPSISEVDGALRVEVELEAGIDDPTAGALGRLGSDTLSGATVGLPDDSGAVVLAAPPGGRYLARLLSDTGSGPWVDLVHAPTESPDGAGDGVAGDGHQPPVNGPDGAAGAEGFGQRPTALGPLLVDADDVALEIVAVGSPAIRIDAYVLPADDGPLSDSDEPTDGPVDGPPVVAGRTQVGPGGPDIVPRTGWTDRGWAADNGGCSNGPWYSDNLQAVVVHHTVTTNDYRQDQVPALLRAMLYAHVDINGWCDLGYNVVVDRFGTVWEGRTGGVDRPVIGGHAKGFNTATMGIALLGQHQPRARPAAVAPTGPATEAARAVAQWKLALHGIDPAGQTWLRNRSSRPPHRLADGRWHLVPTILGHRDVGVTSCPGSLGLEVVDDLRANLEVTGLDRQVVTFPQQNPHPHGPGLVVLDERGRLRATGSAVITPDPAGDPGPIAPPSPGPVAVAGTAVDGVAGGWTLHVDGMLQPFGSAPALADRPAGDRPVADLAVSSGVGGWVVAVDGTIHAFGDAPALAANTGPDAAPVTAAAITPAGRGVLLHADGRLTPVGDTPAPNPAAADEFAAVDVAVTPDGTGGWLVAADGRLSAFGSAPDATVRTGVSLDGRTVVAVVASASGQGGWLLTAEGGLWPFGRERLILPATAASAAAVALDAAFVGSHLPASFLDGDQGRYLAAVSRLFRSADPTPDEVERWEGWLVYGGGRLEVTLELARSPAWHEDRVDRLYRDVLGREPDPSGRAFWTSRLADGVPLADVGSAFYGSSEYVRSAGSTAAYVELLYRTLLGRDPDGDGLAYWVEVLDGGQADPSQVTVGFYQSEEFRTQRVRQLYQEILARPPDPVGQAFWVQRLAQTTDGVVAAELATSDEFYRLAQP